MGLDVYLHYYKDNEKFSEILARANAGEDSHYESVRKKSKKHPKNYWKIGYFRSSYNSGGFNHIAGNLIGKDLYYMFEHSGSQYMFKPDWNKARARACEMVKELQDKIDSKRAFKVNAVSFFKESMPSSEEEVIKIVKKQWDEYEKREDKKFDCSHYSNMNGEFSIKSPVKVVAIVPGKTYGDMPCAYVVTKADDWVKEAIENIEIVIETCDYVLSQPNKDNYFLYWSA